MSKLLAERMKTRWACFPDRTTPIGKIINEWLLGNIKVNDGCGPPEDAALIFQGLMLANRTEKLGLLKSSAFNSLVLDRYWQSGYAYGKLDGLDPEYLIQMHSELPGATLNILLDVPVGVSMARQEKRGAPKEHYEAEIALTEIRSHYLELWDRMRSASHAGPDRWPVVNANRPQGEVLEDLVGLVARARTR